MKLINHKRLYLLLLLLSWGIATRSFAQKEQKSKTINLLAEQLKNTDDKSRPSKKSWRGNRRDFSIDKGVLSLNSTSGYGKRLLFTSLPLGNQVSWSGSVRLDKLPTKSNYAYILLCDLPQYYSQKGTETQVEYLALSIAGQGRTDVALVTLRLTLKGQNIQFSHIKLGADHNLINAPLYPIREKFLEFSYKVCYDYTKGKLSFALDYVGDDEPYKVLNTIDWREIQPQDEKHSFGFFVNYSKSFSQGIHFDKLAVHNSLDTTEEGGKSDDDKPNKDKGKEGQEEGKKSEKEGEKAILLTEIMPNPKPQSAEYVELYNPNNQAIDLSTYHIGIGSSMGRIRKIRLSKAGEIKAKSYLVLSTNPKAILSSYPTCPKDLVSLVKLPQMNNKGCYVFLYKDGRRIDGVHYNPKLLPRGYQSKRGIAWEREGLEHIEYLEDIVWHIASPERGYASVGLPNSQGVEEPKGTSPKQKGKKGRASHRLSSLAELQTILAKDKSLEVELFIYNVSGTLLCQRQNASARDFIKSFAEQGCQCLQSLGLLPQAIILHFKLPSSKGRAKELILKTVNY